jgi:hypothetical protein
LRGLSLAVEMTRRARTHVEFCRFRGETAGHMRRAGCGRFS